MSVTPRLALTYLAEGQANAEIDVNNNNNILEALLSGVLVSRADATPPGSPANGDVYLVAASPTGAWTGQAGKLAIYYDGWYFRDPMDGLTLAVADEKQYIRYSFTDTAWIAVPGGASKSFASGSTATIDANTAHRWHCNSLAANITLTLSNGKYDGQPLEIRIKQDGTGSRTLSFASSPVAFGTTYAGITLTTTASKTDWMDYRWNANLSKWMLVNFVKGM